MEVAVPVDREARRWRRPRRRPPRPSSGAPPIGRRVRDARWLARRSAGRTRGAGRRPMRTRSTDPAAIRRDLDRRAPRPAAPRRVEHAVRPRPRDVDVPRRRHLDARLGHARRRRRARSTLVTTQEPAGVRRVVHALVPGVGPDEREVDRVVGPIARSGASTPDAAASTRSDVHVPFACSIACHRPGPSAGVRRRRPAPTRRATGRRSRRPSSASRPCRSRRRRRRSPPPPAPSSSRSRRRSRRGSRCPCRPTGCVQSRSIARCAAPSASTPRSGGPSW